jgi:hypothetical protein
MPGSFTASDSCEVVDDPGFVLVVVALSDPYGVDVLDLLAIVHCELTELVAGFLVVVLDVFALVFFALVFFALVFFVLALFVRAFALVPILVDRYPVGLVVVVEHDAIEVEEPLGGIGRGVLVHFGGSGEPFAGLIAATDGQQRVGVGIPEPGHPRLVRGQLAHLQHRHRGLVLAEVGPGAGRHDEKLDRLVGGELVPVGCAVHVNGSLRSTERPLAVGQYGQVGLLPAHPVIRPEFADRRLPLTGVVGGETDRLPHRRDARGQTARDERMRQGRLGIVVNQLARRDQP